MELLLINFYDAYVKAQKFVKLKKKLKIYDWEVNGADYRYQVKDLTYALEIHWKLINQFNSPAQVLMNIFSLKFIQSLICAHVPSRKSKYYALEKFSSKINMRWDYKILTSSKHFKSSQENSVNIFLNVFIQAWRYG